MIAFFMAALVPIPALRAFSLQVQLGTLSRGGGGQEGVTSPSSDMFSYLQAAVVVVFNFAMVLFVFPAILSLDLYRREKRRLDILCCFYRYRRQAGWDGADPTGSPPRSTGWLCSSSSTSSPPSLSSPFLSPCSPCSSRVIQIQPQELADANDNHACHPSPYGHPSMATSTQITTTVQAFTRCDPSGHHVVTVLPPTSQVCTSPAVLLPPTDPLGSQVFTSSSSTRDLLAQLDEAKGGRECVPLPFCRWSLADFAREKYAPLLLRTRTKVRWARPWRCHPRWLGGMGPCLTPPRCPCRRWWRCCSWHCWD